MAIKYFTKQYAGMLPDLFAKKSAFLRAFGGVLQVKDGVTENDTFMELKVSDTDVVIQKYTTDANVAFGTGTGNTSRFGPRKEVKSVNKQVSYDAPLAINEGIDDFTVNDIKDQVVAERLALHGVAWAQHVDGLLGKLLSDSASESLNVKLEEDSVTKLFSDAHKKFVNNNVSTAVPWVAYAQVYTDRNTGRTITVQASFQGFFVSDSTGPYVRVTPNGISTSSDKSYNSFQIGAGITINLERRGDMVEATLSGSINYPLTSNTKFSVGLIPVGYRPNRTAYIMVHMTSSINSSHIDVEPNGVCTWWGTSTNTGAPRGHQMWFTNDSLQN